MQIEFTGIAISDGRLIISDSILQGTRAGFNRIFLMPVDKPSWVEVRPETVKQTKYEHRDCTKGE